jgi:hypothetical protein
VGVCDAVVLIESSRPGPARAARARLVETLAGVPGVTTPVAPGHFRLEFEKVKLAV